MVDRDEYMDGMSGFRELSDRDDALLDEEDREAEEAISAWLHSRAEAAASEADAVGHSTPPISIRFEQSTRVDGDLVVDGDLYMDCLTMFLLTQLDFELEAQSAAPMEEGGAIPDDRWRAEGEGPVPEDFRERLLRAEWKAQRQWRIEVEIDPTAQEDYETQSRNFFRILAGSGVCWISEERDYENPFEGMTPMDFGDFPDDFDDDCAM